MQLKTLIENKYKVIAILNRGKCSVEKSLNGDIEDQYQASCDELLVKIEQISKTGTLNLSDKISHKINSNPSIWELIQGRLRIFYFHGENRSIIICSDIIIKKTQKVDKKLLNRAISAHDKYCESIKNGNMYVVEDKE